MINEMKKNNYYKFLVFYHKIKTRTYIDNLRHNFLYLYVINNWLKVYRNTSRGKENIHVYKINEKEFLKRLYFQKFEFC